MADLPVKRLGRLKDLGEHQSRFGPLDLAQDHTSGPNQGVFRQGSRPLGHRQLGFEREQASGRISQAKRTIRFAQGGFQAGCGPLLARDVQKRLLGIRRSDGRFRDRCGFDGVAEPDKLGKMRQ
jgi:hypothetical protein